MRSERILEPNRFFESVLFTLVWWANRIFRPFRIDRTEPDCTRSDQTEPNQIIFQKNNGPRSDLVWFNKIC